MISGSWVDVGKNGYLRTHIHTLFTHHQVRQNPFVAKKRDRLRQENGREERG